MYMVTYILYYNVIFDKVVYSNKYNVIFDWVVYFEGAGDVILMMFDAVVYCSNTYNFCSSFILKLGVFIYITWIIWNKSRFISWNREVHVVEY